MNIGFDDCLVVITGRAGIGRGIRDRRAGYCR
jgi:hypothetical protein